MVSDTTNCLEEEIHRELRTTALRCIFKLPAMCLQNLNTLTSYDWKSGVYDEVKNRV